MALPAYGNWTPGPNVPIDQFLARMAAQWQRGGRARHLARRGHCPSHKSLRRRSGTVRFRDRFGDRLAGVFNRSNPAATGLSLGERLQSVLDDARHALTLYGFRATLWLRR